MYKLALAWLAAMMLASPLSAADAGKPTVVLVHGAFADGASWNHVLKILHDDGYQTIAVANPLRGVQSDARYVASIVDSIDTSVVLVGHSYGGSVISEAAVGKDNVKSLVFVAAFAPDKGESAAELSGKFPGGTLASALANPVTLPDGGADLYIDQKKFREQFAHDVSAEEASLMAATQRPIAKSALDEPASAAAWKSIPSWFVYGDQDKNIPPAVQKFMAERAKSKNTVVIPGASHVVMISNPKTVASLIENAAH
ncbi:alpha/beta fold hydrolase [Neorhizobium sp. NPDC001467]|uniref:alpha/beta fold hydrolase n=1 Tax=Neorhizobium sp. NPDC001467 TaxID=3390595 RepID=UPI003CFD3196